MRVLFLTHNIVGDNGGGVFSSHLLCGIRESIPAEVSVFTVVDSNTGEDCPVLRYSGFWGVFPMLLSVRKKIKQVDVVHACDVWPYGVIGYISGLGLKKKLVVTAIGSGSILPLYKTGLAFLSHCVLRRADRIVAISQFTRDEILKKIPGLSITIITPGIDLEEYIIIAQKNIVSDAIRSIQPYILSVGMIRWRKGYKRSIRAFARVLDEFPQMKYVIVGSRQSEKYFNELQEIIRELHLEGKVLFQERVKSREELLQWYRGAELFCLFSENVGHDVEGFGIVFLEAAACGLPVVGIGDCGIEDAVVEGRNGLLVRSRDPEKFADSICSILRGPEKKKAMSEESKKFAKRFSWKNKAEEYRKIYQSLSR